VSDRARHDAGLLRFAAASAGAHTKVEPAWVPVKVHEVSLLLEIPAESSDSVGELHSRSHARRPMSSYVAKRGPRMPDPIVPPVRRSPDTSSGGLDLQGVTQEANHGGIGAPSWGWLADSVSAAERRERRQFKQRTALDPFASLFDLDTRRKHDDLTATLLAPYSSQSGPFGQEEPEEHIWWNWRREEAAPKR